jgi:glycosyltransferase involved in cell wall biosynthesis
MAPRVSVVVPTFNRSRLLSNAIESVLAQTYTDYELIVIDDGSTDDTHEKLKAYMERIRYFYQENRGASAAQNKGIEVARGKWVSILASDDVWLPTKLERQIRAVTTFGNEFGACFTDCTWVGNPDVRLSVFEQAGLKSNLEFGHLDDPIKYILGRYAPIWVQSLMVLRSLLKELNGFDEAMAIQEDTDLIFRLAFKTKFCFVSAPLVRIDATPSLPRLTDLVLHRNDRIYAWSEYRYRKWLGLTEFVDPETRRTIQEHLRDVYYGWAIARLYQLKFAGALEKINEIRAMGTRYTAILLTLLSRARRKLSRTFGGR